MELDASKVQDLVRLVQQKFPGWKSVADPAFVGDEIAYKRAAAAKVQELLDQQELQALLDAGQYSDVIDRFDQAGKATNLLYNVTPRTGDLSLIHQPEIDAAQVALALVDLIHGDGDQVDRLVRFVATATTHDWPQKWAFVTYFPFLLNSETEIFLKPEATRWFLRTFDTGLSLPATPDAETYAAVRQVFYELREALAPFGVQDMIDVQSMVYVAHRQATGESDVFTAAIDQLRAVLEAISMNSELVGVIQARDEVIARYQPLFAPAHLPKLTAEAFESFLLYDNNKHWTGINRYGSRMTQDMPQLQKALGILLDEGPPLAERYDQAVGMVKGLDKATATPILLVSYPDRYGVWNGKSEPGLKSLKLYPTLPRGATPGQYYAAINDILIHLAAELDVDLWTLDAVWSWLVEEEKPLSPPFDTIFTDREQAEWAFDFIRKTVERLGGVRGDPRFAITLRQGGDRLRLNMGSWTIVDFAQQGTEMHLTTLVGPVMDEAFGPIWSGPFKGDTAYAVYELTLDAAQEWSDAVQAVYERSMDGLAIRFTGWSRSNLRPFHNDEVFQAVFDTEKRVKLLTEGLTQPPLDPRFWRITLPDDLPVTTLDGAVSTVWQVCLAHGIAAINFSTESDRLQVEKFSTIQPGDQVVAFLRNKKIGGVGQVTSMMDETLAKEQPTSQDIFDGKFWFRIGVDWTPVDVNVDDLSKPAANKFGQQTVIEIDEDVYEEVLALIRGDPPPISHIAKEFLGFTPDAFAFLSELAENNNKTWMHANLHRWEGAVREPMRHLFADLGPHVKRTFDPYLAPNELEIVPDAWHTLARIRKNWNAAPGSEYNTYYWGAFYRQHLKKQTDAQLFVNIHPGHIRFGFFAGEQADLIRKQFRDRILSNPDAFLSLITQMGLPEDFQFIRTDGSRQTMTAVNSAEDLTTWVANGDFDVLMYLSAEEAVRVGPSLTDTVLEAMKRVFPVYLWAVADDYETAIARYLEDTPPPGDDIVDENPPPTPYTADNFLDRTHLLPETLADLQAMIADRKQVIFSGPPGTGKTYVAKELGKLLTGLADPPPERLEMIQFHPAYSYEDFIEGIRPKSVKDGDHTVVDYPTLPGVFRRFCETAARRPDNELHVFIIDEINRGNIARIFGELMLLLEYRDQDVPLPYSGKRFTIPLNVVLIGTMNTADRSIALVDMALRRRFHFFNFKADPALFGRWLDHHGTALPYLDQLYRAVVKAIDDDHYAIGPSYFMNEKLDEALLRRIWLYSILPQIEEYYFAQPGKAREWDWDGPRVKAIRQGNDGD